MSEIRRIFKSHKNNLFIIIIVMLLLSVCQPMFMTNTSYAATTAVLEKKWHGSYSNLQFKIKGYNGYGLCAYDCRKPASVGASGTVSDVKNENIIKIVYYVLFKQKGAGLTRTEVSYSHIYLSYTLHGKKSLKDSTQKKLNDALNWSKQYTSKNLPPEYEKFKVYEWTPTGKDKDKQSVAFFSYVTPGSISLIKKSADSKVLGTGMYSLKGAEYTIFKSDRKTEAGKLIVKDENGKTNTVMLSPGKYYVRETKTPANSGFQINDTWLSADVKSGNAIKLVTEGDSAEVPILSNVLIRKQIMNGDSGTNKFQFDLVNVNDNSIRYELTVESGKSMTSPEIEVIAGTYRVSEHLSDGYESVTKPYEFTVKPGETYEIKWVNRMLHSGKLSVVKENLDGMSSDGFKFKLEGILFNKIMTDGEVSYITEKTLTQTEALERAGLDDAWKASSEDLNRINKAAKEGKVGEYPLAFTREINNPEDGEARSIDIKSTVILKRMLENSGEDAGKPVKEDSASIESSEVELANVEAASYKYNSRFEFAGARTEYLDKETGKNYTEIITGTPNSIDKEVPLGRYTVTELMTSAQSERYHDEDGNAYYYAGELHKANIIQTKDITSESTYEDYIFKFKNIPRTSHAAMRKTADIGGVAGMTFLLKSVGKTASGSSYESSFLTDEEGNIDFGDLYAGTYILEEQNFDPDKWINTYPLDGYDSPAIKFTISGNENGTVWIGGSSGNGGTEVGNDKTPARLFRNKHYTKLFLSKIDSDTGLFLPGVKFEIHDEDGHSVASFTLTRNEDGAADIIMTHADVGIRGGNSTGEDTPDDSDSKEYVVIKGLEEGKKYKLVEIEAPQGYLTADSIDFRFSDNMELSVENTIPLIETIASDNDTGTGISMADSNVELTDSVQYRKLIPGREYVLKGTIVYGGDDYKSPEESVVVSDGKLVTEYVSFTPESSDGVQDVIFSFDGSLTAGKDIVIFEELMSGEDTIVSHCDPENKKQTVKLPVIETTAQIDGEDVKDSVMYSNLLSGRRYVCRGWLVDASTGDKIQGSDGFNVFYVNEGEESGTTEVALKSDMSKLAGKRLTAFEELYLAEEDIDKDTGIPTITREILVAEHKELNNEAQTVDIPTHNSPKTGDIRITSILMPVFTIVAAIAGIYVMIKKRRA